MKDAKGHGSEAHSTGVQQIGQPKTYTWAKMPHGMGHVLANEGNLADQLGTVRPQQQRDGSNRYVGSYNYAGTGNASSGYSHHGSVQGAKKYVESQLARFWEPPKIGK
jgi:hypothetical protein